MGLATQLFNHASPATPTLTKGMMLGASGVTHPPLQVVGAVSGFLSTNGNFTDAFGNGQIDYDNSGYMYVADTTNNRVQRFIKSSVTGAWSYDSKCDSLNSLGSAVSTPMVAIDRTRDQIHIASNAQNATGTLVGVWALSSWPSLTVGNRVRSYGTASGSNGAGNLRAPVCLTIVGDFAILCSSTGDYRVIKYNHTTGSLVAEDTNSLWKARFAANADGSKYYSGAQATDTELGLWAMNTSTLAGTTRLDSTSGGTYYRRGSLQQSSGGDASDLVHYGGRIYVRSFDGGRVQAWETSGDTFVDEFLWAGGAGSSESYGLAAGFKPSNIQQMKIGVAAHPTLADDFVAWASNAQNTNSQQSFLLVWPMSTATATWTQTDWSTGTNTLSGILLDGVNLSAEKFKVRLRKNSGSWITARAGSLSGTAFATAISGLGTFTSGDTLTVELSLSTWDRLDGHATLTATHDKLSPSNVSMQLVYEDDAANVYVPYLSNALRGRMTGSAALRGRLGD